LPGDFSTAAASVRRRLRRSALIPGALEEFDKDVVQVMAHGQAAQACQRVGPQMH